ncbi:TetR/AcrR family transcriptional regulator [Clostridiales bacterium COT073_COT-073]|nr:TetR/AcrR family transcriptional regulator [Clostridiales bacterium COT073_COT-073]
MVKFKRLTEEERREQIQTAAKKVFLKKGFQKTTMEDIIAESGMSKGGVYNYYKNTSDILHDLMIAGTKYRFQIMAKDFSNQQLSGQEILVEAMIDKMLDYNEYKAIYAILLQEMKYDEKLRQLYERLKQESMDMFFDFLQENGLHWSEKLVYGEAIIALINSMILGVELLPVREIFQQNREMFRLMLRSLLQGGMEDKSE